MSTVTEATDSEITDLRATQLIPSLRRRFDFAYGRARAREQAPYRRFDFERDRILRSLSGEPPARQLTILRDGIRTFEQWAADPSAWPGTKFGEEQAATLATAQAAGEQLRAAGLMFNASAFVGALRSRGIVLTAAAGGKVRVSPLSGLNDVDHRTIADHRAAILAVLNDVGEF